MENLQLAKIANQVRKDIVTGVYNAKSGHPGGSLSAADMLTDLYYQKVMLHLHFIVYWQKKDIFQEKISKH